MVGTGPGHGGAVFLDSDAGVLPIGSCGDGGLRLVGTAPVGGAVPDAGGMAPGGGAILVGTVPAGGNVLLGTSVGGMVPGGGTVPELVPVGAGLV